VEDGCAKPYDWGIRLEEERTARRGVSMKIAITYCGA
jgi:hypothetical protein